MEKIIKNFLKGYVSHLDISPNIQNGQKKDWKNIAMDIEHSTTIILEGLPNEQRKTITRRVRAVNRRFKARYKKS